jgi:hypothetical protein
MSEASEHAAVPDEPRWAIAADVGKRILVGMTYLDRNGNVTERTQHVGEVIAVAEHFITVRWDGGEETTLPPEVADAPPGVYRLRSTGQEVENPDLLMKWTVHPPQEGARSEESRQGDKW